MKLYIDTADREKVVVGIDNERFETKAHERSSQELLPFIEKILKKNGKTVKDITEIQVNTGPGSFTGLRVGLAVADTLGWILKVPVNGVDISKEGSVDIVYN